MLLMKKLYFSLILSAFLGLTLASSASAEISADVHIQRYGARNLSKNELVYSQNVKAVDGDELEFSINIKNISSNQAAGAILYVYLPTGFPLDSNSIYVDGHRTGGNISNGLFLGNINTGAQKDIVFKTRVNASFNGYAAIQALTAGENFNTDSQYISITKNGAEVSTTVTGFTPTPIPTPTSTPTSATTLTNTNQSNNLAISLMGQNLTKEEVAWQKAIKAQPGHLLEFSVMLYTNSNLIARNVQVKAGLDNFLDFVPGSITVNGAPVSGNLTIDPVVVGHISVHETKFVKFQVKVRQASQFGSESIVLSNAVQAWTDNNIRITDYASVSVSTKQTAVKAVSASTTLANKNNGTKVTAANSNQKFELTVPAKETVKNADKRSYLLGNLAFGDFGLLLILILSALVILLFIFWMQERKKNRNRAVTA